MPINLPNILTIGRLLAAPFVAFAFVLFSSPFADYLAFVLFVVAALTDFLDGYLARKWEQTSAFGRMMDPIADKVMVVIALAILVGLWQGHVLIIVPTVLILFREVFVSGLREFLGAQKDLLQVTRLAKWKTTVQMFAIGILFLAGVFQNNLSALYHQMPPSTYEAILNGEMADEFGLISASRLSDGFSGLGIGLLWIAAVMTILSGVDYFRKALPLLRDDAS